MNNDGKALYIYREWGDECGMERVVVKLYTNSSNGTQIFSF